MVYAPTDTAPLGVIKAVYVRLFGEMNPSGRPFLGLIRKTTSCRLNYLKSLELGGSDIGQERCDSAMLSSPHSDVKSHLFFLTQTTGDEYDDRDFVINCLLSRSSV